MGECKSSWLIIRRSGSLSKFTALAAPVGQTCRNVGRASTPAAGLQTRYCGALPALFTARHPGAASRAASQAARLRIRLGYGAFSSACAAAGALSGLDAPVECEYISTQRE